MRGTILRVLRIIFLPALILYSATSSVFTMFLHLVLIVSGLTISILMVNKVTKSSNSLKSKIYFCFIISFLLFFSILFFWYLGNHRSIDDKGLTTAIIIFPSILLFGVISFIRGLVLSIKRRKRKDFDYNLKPFLLIATLLSLILLSVFFYNPVISKMAITFEDENLCYLTFITSNSYMFTPSFYSACLMKIGIAKADARICAAVCDEKHISKESCQMNDLSICYVNIARKKVDIELCPKTANPSHCVIYIAEDTKDISLCELLAGGENYRADLFGMFDRDFCLKSVAPAIGDKNICNSIKNQETRDYCLERYESNRKRYI